jgi:hypothetical protein
LVLRFSQASHASSVTLSTAISTTDGERSSLTAERFFDRPLSDLLDASARRLERPRPSVSVSGSSICLSFPFPLVTFVGAFSSFSSESTCRALPFPAITFAGAFSTSSISASSPTILSLWASFGFAIG